MYTFFATFFPRVVIAVVDFYEWFFAVYAVHIRMYGYCRRWSVTLWVRDCRDSFIIFDWATGGALNVMLASHILGCGCCCCFFSHFGSFGHQYHRWHKIVVTNDMASTQQIWMMMMTMTRIIECLYAFCCFCVCVCICAFHHNFFFFRCQFVNGAFCRSSFYYIFMMARTYGSHKMNQQKPTSKLKWLETTICIF